MSDLIPSSLPTGENVTPPLPPTSPPVTAGVVDAEHRVVDFHREITHGGDTYIYNYRLCSIEQILLAKSVFDLAAQMKQKPPRDMKALEISGQMDYVAKGLGYLLRQKLSGGVLEQFERRQAREITLKWVLSLSGDYYDTLEEIREDFFDRAGIVQLDYIGQFMPLLQGFQSLSLDGSALTANSTQNEPEISESINND